MDHPDVLDAFINMLPIRLNALKEHQDLFEQCKEPGAQSSERALELTKRGIPACAFLDPVSSLCLIYQVRSLVCAAYVSIVPARFCASEPKSNMSRQMSGIFHAAQNELNKLQKKHKIKAAKQIDLSLCVANRLQELGVIRLKDDGSVTRLQA